MSAPSERPRLDIVIVTWNSGTRLDRCLDSIDRASRDGLLLNRVVVVDNASEPELRPASRPGVTFIDNAVNVGFAVACNQGAADSRADYLLFLNPDTSIAENALVAAIAQFERLPSVAILGLPLVDDRAAYQATCGRFLTVREVFNQVSGLSTLAPSAHPGFRMTEWDHAETRQVDYVSGACLLVRRSVFAVLGGFDARFAIYLEDADLALRARELGWDTLFFAGPPVYHESGWNTGRARGLRLSHAWRSLLAYAWLHLDWLRASAITAIVLGLAPIARGGQAIAHGSWRELAEAASGYGRLWLLIAREAHQWRRMPDAHAAPVDSSLHADIMSRSRERSRA
jgi:GT2 family glycosyltransferase